MRLPNCVLEEMEKDATLSAAERGLYLLAWARDPASLSGLGRLVRMDRGSVGRACRHLAERGWMKMVKHPGGIRAAAIIPDACQIVMAHDLEDEYDMVTFGGEYLTRKRVDWYLRRDEYVCNARPALLENPETKRRLEYDTYDRKQALATEYNGSQHYRETPDYRQEEVGKQKAHDLMKQSMSEREGVTLLTFTYRDLRPGVLEARLDAAVPHFRRGYVDMRGPYMKVLNRISTHYAAKVDRAEQAAAERESVQQR